MMRSKAFDWAVLAGLVVVWGSAFALLKVSTLHIPPAWNTAGRLLVAAPFLAAVVLVGGHRPPPLKDRAWRVYAVLGLVGMTVPFFLFAFAAQRLPSAVNAICNGASPIFTGLLAHLFLASDRLTGRKAAGVALGFAGLVVLTAPRLAGGFTVEAAGLAAALAGAFLYGVANVLTKNAPPVPSAVGGFMMCATAAFFALIALPFLGPLPPWPPWPAALALVGLGVFTTALGSIGYIFLVRRRGPLFMSMSIYLAPVWAAGLGLVLLGERPGVSAYAALALILAGVALVTVQPRR